MIFGIVSRRRHFAQVVQGNDPCAAAFHLLKIVFAFHVAQEDQAFQRLDIGTGRDHIDRDGDARIVVVAKLGQHRFGVFLGVVGDLFAKGVAFVKFLAHDLNDIIGVAVGLGKNQRLGHFVPMREDFRQVVFERPDDRANLAGVHHFIIEFFRRIGQVFVQLLPAFASSQFLAFVDEFAFPDGRALFADLRFDQVHGMADVDPVDHGFFVGVLADDVLIEKAKGPYIGRRGQPDQKRIKILQHLFPEIIDAAVAFVDHDKVKKLQRQFGIVDHRQRLPLAPLDFAGVGFLFGFAQLFPFENRIQPLDGADADLAVGRHIARFQPLYVV